MKESKKDFVWQLRRRALSGITNSESAKLLNPIEVPKSSDALLNRQKLANLLEEERLIFIENSNSSHMAYPSLNIMHKTLAINKWDVDANHFGAVRPRRTPLSENRAGSQKKIRHKMTVWLYVITSTYNTDACSPASPLRYICIGKGQCWTTAYGGRTFSWSSLSSL